MESEYAMESRGYSIPLLNDKNFPTWKVQMKMSLMKDSLYGIVDGTEVAPTDAAALSKFNIRRDRALAIIVGIQCTLILSWNLCIF